jgi:hypothetical protein
MGCISCDCCTNLYKIEQLSITDHLLMGLIRMVQSNLSSVEKKIADDPHIGENFGQL